MEIDFKYEVLFMLNCSLEEQLFLYFMISNIIITMPFSVLRISISEKKQRRISQTIDIGQQERFSRNRIPTQNILDHSRLF